MAGRLAGGGSEVSWRKAADDLPALFHSANALIFRLDSLGKVSEWNAKCEEVSGSPASEILGKSFVHSPIISRESRESLMEFIKQALSGAETTNLKLPLNTKSGKLYMVLLNLSPCRNPAGEISGLLCLGLDVTELNEQMQANARVADDLARVIDTANAPIFGIDTFGKINVWNQKAELMLGFTRKETMGHDLVEKFITKELRHSVNQVLSLALEGEYTANFEVALFTKVGERREVLLNATPRRGPSGEVIGVICVGQDITQIRQMTREQERIADDLSRLIDFANAPIFGVDVNGMVTEWNRKSADMLGYTKEETLGKKLVENFIQAEQRASVSAVLGDALCGKETANFELPLLSKFGERYTVLLNATARQDAKGSTIGVVGVGQDITALNRAMAESKRVADDLTRLIETANAPIFGVDTAGRVTEWNQKLAELSHFTKEETIGRPLVENFITQEYSGAVSYVLLKALHGEETASFELPLVKSGQKRAMLLLNATTRRGSEGEVIGVICVGQDITQINAMTAEQQRVADDLWRLIDSANAPIFGIDTDGLVTEWNRKAADILGFTKEESIGKHLVQTFIQPEDRKSVEDVLTKALRGQETANYELPLVSKHGKSYTILLNATARCDAEGKTFGVVGVGQDITELKQVMAEARRVADDLTRLIDTANAPIFGIDVHGNVTEWNAKASSLLGFSKEETIGKSLVASFITDEFKDSVNKVLTSALMGHESTNFEFPLFTKFGQRKEILLNATTRRGPNGEVTGVIGVGQDITEIREITSEQERIADDLSRLIDSANAPIFGVDRDGMVTEWNRKASEMLGYTREETMGKHLVENFIQKETQSLVASVLSKALTGLETANFALPLLSKRGSRYTVLLNATSRRDAKGQIIGVVGVGQDITELGQVMAQSKSVADDLTRIIETANAPIFGIDTQGIITEWNAKASTLTGFSKADTMGKNLVDNFITDEFKASVKSVLDAAQVGRESANFEFPLFSRDGDRRDILLNATTRRGPNGEVTGVIGVGQDITQMKQITIEHQRMADDLARLIDSANAPIFGVDLNGMVTEWNRKSADMLGYTKKESLGKNLVERFIETKNRSNVNQVLGDGLSGKETANFECALLAKSGTLYTVLLNATSRRNAKGEIIGVVCVGQDITELNQVLSESKRVADDLRRIIETANAPIFGIDKAGKVTEWNAKASSLLGYSKSEAVGKSLVSNFITEEFQESVTQVLSAALLGQETANFEFCLFTKTGQRKDILLNATTRRGPDGEVTGVIGVGQDITQIREITSYQERIADDLSRLIQSANAPILGVDLEGLINEWNRKAADMLGFTKEEAMGQNLVLNFVQPENRESVLAVFSRAMLGEDAQNYELELISKSGKSYTALFSATARRDAKGMVKGVVGVGQDITELKRASERAQRIADGLTRLIETANAPIFGIDLQGKVNEWNAKATEVSGYSKQETLDKHLVNTFIHLDHRAAVLEVLERALSGDEVANFELHLFTRGGQCREILLNATPRRGDDGSVIGVLGVGQDITALNQQRKEALRIADDLGRIVETANAPIFGVDVQGRVTEWNQKLAELSFVSKEEALGNNFMQFIGETVKDSVGQLLLKALNAEQTESFCLPLTKDGEEKAVVLLNATARRGPNNEVTGVICVGQDITQINTMAAEQQRIADDLSRLIDSANAPIFGVDLNGMVTEWNRKAADMLGYTKQETMGKNLVESFIQPEDRTSVDEILRKALSGIETANYTLPLMAKFGKRYTVLLNATTRRDAKGLITGVVGVGQDITQLKQVMAESERIADDLTRLIETANAPIFGIDTEGNVTEWNAKASSLLGFSKEETKGKCLVTNFITEEFKERVHEVLAAALQGKETANFEFPLFTKTGQRKEILLNATTRRGRDDEVTGVIGVGQDITAIREITSDQQRIADDLSRLIDTANAPIFGVDLQGNVTEWNRKMAELLCFSREETMNQNLLERFIQPEDKDSVDDVLQSALKGMDPTNCLVKLMSKSGIRYTILMNATARRDAHGSIVGAIGVGQDITTLNQVMAESKRVADDLMRLIETANAPIFGIDTEGKVSEWNAKASSLLGFAKSETMGKSLVANFITDEFKVPVKEVLEGALKGKETANFEFPLFTKEGERRVILLNATTRRGPDGEITGVIGVGQDITDIREIMREQERVADDLSRLIETANAPIFGVDLSGMVSEWNRKAADMLGFTKDEAMGKNLVQHFIQDENRESVQGVLQRAMRGYETANFEVAMLSRNHRRLTVLLNATTRRDARGHVIGVVGVGQDITEINELMAETKNAKEAADRTANGLARLIDSANAPIFGVDDQRQVTEWNQMMGKLTGIGREKVMGKKLLDHLLDPGDQQVIDSVLNDALNGRGTANFELRFNCRDKVGNQAGVVVLLLSATARLDAMGAIVGVVSIGQDITQHKSLEERKMRFMAVVSHELRSPIHGICGLSEAMALTECDPKRQKKLNMIKSCSTRLLDLVTDIMDVSALRSKTMKLSKAPCSLSQVIEETVHILDHAVDKHGQSVKRSSVKLVNSAENVALPIIEADTHRCTQVLYNLVMNALKFTPEGEVTISALHNKVNDTVEVSIADTGIGISPTHLERIFEPFEQEDDGERRAFGGIGLGLSISREVVERHGGKITVKSVVGKGSTFTIILPVMSSQESQQMGTSPLDNRDLDGRDSKPPIQSAPLTADLKDLRLTNVAMANERPSRTGSGRRALTPEEMSSKDSLEPMLPIKEGVESCNVVRRVEVPRSTDVNQGAAKRDTIVTDENCRILSVDDDEVNQEVIQAMFASRGNQVSIAMNGASCLEQIEAAAEISMLPHVVLLDSMMPGMSGLDVCKALRERFTPLELPIIMLTCRTASEEVAMALQTGCNDYVKKPFNSVELSARVQKQLTLMNERTQLINDNMKLHADTRALEAQIKAMSRGAQQPIPPVSPPDPRAPRAERPANGELPVEAAKWAAAAAVRPAPLASSVASKEWTEAQYAAPMPIKPPSRYTNPGGLNGTSTASLSPGVPDHGASAVPEDFAVRLRHENAALRERVRILEKEARKMRSELAANKAHLASLEADSEDVWQRLADAEEQALERSSLLNE